MSADCDPVRLLIDSRQRDSGSVSSNNFVYSLQSQIGPFSKAKLEWVSIPTTIYNINSANNALSFDDGVSRLATLTPGQYSATTLAAHIQTQMTASGGQAYTCTYDSIATMKFTISAAGAFQIFFDSTSSPYLQLGFPNTTTASNTTFTSPNIPSLERPDVLNISIAEWDTQVLTGAKTAITSSFLVPIEDTSGTIDVYYSTTDNCWLPLNPHKKYNQLHVQLQGTSTATAVLGGVSTDVSSTLVSLNNADWSCYITLYPITDNCGCCGGSRKRRRHEEVV